MEHLKEGENPLLKYYKPIRTAEGLTLSIDKIVIDYKLNPPSALDEFVALLNMLPIRFAVDTRQWESFKIGSFRQNYAITFQNGNSFWLGVALNSTKTEWCRVRLEVNPNKCATHTAFLAVLAFLNDNTRPMHTAIKRYDLAIDIPVERENARLVKDGRVYSERRHGKEWTEYLGAQSSHIGRVKLYNKQKEAGLPYSLTRLEVTLDPTTPYDKLPWPKAFYIACPQIDMAELNITDTERYILSALMAGFGSTKDLCRKAQEKMRTLMGNYISYITITQQEHLQILFYLRSFLRYPQCNLGLGNIIPDQPPLPHSDFPSWVQKAEGGACCPL